MLKSSIRWLPALALAQFLLGSETAGALEWDPISFKGSVGSWAASVMFQPSKETPSCLDASQLADDSHACKKRSAFEFTVGLAESDEQTSLGEDIDVFYGSLGYRYYVLQNDEFNRVRLFTGVGLGAYDPQSGPGSSEIGLNLKVGGEFSWRNRQPDKLHAPVELSVTYHRLESGLDFFDYTVGIRLLLPGD